MKKYRIYFCLNGSKRKYVEKIDVDKVTFENAVDIWPYDVIDYDEFNLWFDYGDE